MTLKSFVLLFLSLVAVADVSRGAEPAIEHRFVYHEAGRFGGWPANHGIWSWGNEILVGFSVGYHKDLGPEFHNIDRERPEEHLFARSHDGGLTWSLENPAKKQGGVLLGTRGMRHGTVPPEYQEADPVPLTREIDFTHPDFAMTLRMAGVHMGSSRFYHSPDRGHTWQGPFEFPLLGQPGIAARTDYVVNGAHDCLVFVTAAKSNEREGHPLCARTLDGGRSWKLVSFIGPEPSGYSIMPSTVRTAPRELVTTLRRWEAGPPKRSWIEGWKSTDDGQSWKPLPGPIADTGEGNPPHLLRLQDGRLCLTYAVRAQPFGMFARISRDQGATWSEPIVLRNDGGGRDIGYPRSIQRPDGRIVTIYYFWDQKTGPERYIAATLWSPDAPQ
jgi:BNR repeat-like domain